MFIIDPERMLIMDALCKAITGEERPGHLYTKRWRVGDRYHYEYPKDHKYSAEQHHAEEYKPPTERFTDEETFAKLIQLGDRLEEIQRESKMPGAHYYEKDSIGFNLFDMRSWLGKVETLDPKNPEDVNSLRDLLYKYKDQFISMHGIDNWYQTGMEEWKHEKNERDRLAKEQGTAVVPRWSKLGGLELAVKGKLPKSAFNDYLEINRRYKFNYGIFFTKETDSGDPAWIVPPKALVNFPFDKYKEELKAIGIDMLEVPEKPKTVEKLEVKEGPISAVEAIELLKRKQLRDTVIVSMVDSGPHEGSIAFRSTFSEKFNEIFSNKTSIISGITEYVPDLLHARTTKNFDLANEAIEKIRELMPHSTLIIDDGVRKAQEAKEIREKGQQAIIPEVQAKLASEINLFPFQNAGVRFLMETDGNALIGDEMGLGKTIQTLAYAAATGKRTLVICPRVVRHNWLEEGKRFFPGNFIGKELIASNLRKEGMPDLSKVSLATINYEVLEKFMPAIKAAGFDLIVVDESHRIKNPKAQMTQNVQEIAKDVKHKILLSGTAIKNKKEELFTQLELIKPGLFRSKDELKRATIGSTNRKLSSVYLARAKSQVIKDLPPKTFSIVSNPDVKDLPAQWPNDIGEMSGMKAGLAAAKVPITVEFVNEILDTSESNVLVFTDSIPAAEKLKAQIGDRAVLHTGKSANKDRVTAIEHFDPKTRKEGDPVRVFVATTASAGIGINLQSADKVVFNDLPWTPADLRQAEDRAHRIGQVNPVNTYWMIASNHAFDVSIGQMIKDKYELAKKVLEGKKISKEEDEWLNKPVTLDDLKKQLKKKIDKTFNVPVTQGTMETPDPVKQITGQPPIIDEGFQKRKEEYEKQKARKQATQEKEDAKQRAFYDAVISKTNPTAAKYLDKVPKPLAKLYSELHAVEATGETWKTGNAKIIPTKEAKVLQRWFTDSKKRGSINYDPNILHPNEDTYVYNSPAGTLILRFQLGSEGRPSEWEVNYTSQNKQVSENMTQDERTYLDQFKENQKEEKPKLVISAEPKEQLSLFKALSNDNFVLFGNDFDLCMSLADSYIEKGLYDEALDLIKAATHKYLRRFPSGKPSPRWYYVYKITSKHHTANVQEGEKIKLTHEGQTGHYEVKKVHPNEYVTVQHDETGHQMSVHKQHLHEMFSEEHKAAIDEAHKRLQHTFEAAKQFGTEKQQTKAKTFLRQHEDRFVIKTPERIAEQRGQALSVLAAQEGTVENHMAAAAACQQAADMGGDKAELFKKLANTHKKSARSKKALDLSAEALKDSESRFHVPSDDNKAGTPVIVMPKKREVKAKGAFIGTKESAYRALKNTGKNTDWFDNFAQADKAYADYKAGKGPKPPPMEGGDMDALNQALNVEKPIGRGKPEKDRRVSSPLEAFERLTKQTRRWDSDTMGEALKAFTGALGHEVDLPSEAQDAIEKVKLAQADAARAEEMGGEYEDAQIHNHHAEMEEKDSVFDAENWKGDIDTSFDFGFDAEPEENPKEAYKAKGVQAKTFKGWFGDFEKNPAEASKVVKKDGSPQEQSNMSPIVVYHGTAIGGYTAFDTKKADRYALYGEGFYFTEDGDVAREYTKKDTEDRNRIKAMHGIADDKGDEIKHLPKEWAQKIIDSTPGYGPKQGPERDSWDAYMAAALKRSMEPEGANVTKFLQEYRNPSGPVLDSYGKVKPMGRGGDPAGLVQFWDRLSSSGKNYQPLANPPQVFECFLNIRKPVDMDQDITEAEFKDLAGYLKERQKDQYAMKHNDDAKAGPETWDNSDNFMPQNLSVVLKAHDENKFSKELSFDSMKQIKKLAKKYTRSVFTAKAEEKEPQHKIFHISPEDKLTWGDAHYILTNGHESEIAQKYFRDYAEKRGYDGMAHTGGWNTGNKEHKVWVAWKPNQIKAAKNEGTFNPTTDDIYKAMNKLDMFVIIPEKLEKAEKGGQATDHLYIKREGTSGHYRYTYPLEVRKEAEAIPVPAIADADIETKATELANRPTQVLEAFKDQAEGYVVRYGAGAPKALHRWIKVAELALEKKKETPKMVIKEPEKDEPVTIETGSKPTGFKIPEKPKAKAKPAQLAFTLQPKAETTAKIQSKEIQEKPKVISMDGKIEEVGEHVWGSRKDLAQVGKITDVKQLEDMSYDDAAYLVTKKNLVPVHTLETLKEKGLTPGTAHMALALLSSIINKPQDDQGMRKSFVADSQLVVESVLNCKNLDQFRGLIQELRSKQSSVSKWDIVRDIARDEDRHDVLKEMQAKDPDAGYVLGNSYSRGTVIMVKAVKPLDSLGSKFASFIKRGKAYDSAYTEALTADNAWTMKPGEVPIDGWAYLQKRGQLENAKAQEIITKRRKVIERNPVEKPDVTREVPEKPERSGGTFKLTKGDAERIRNDFGLKMVNFGQNKYMTQGDREHHLTQLEGALHDFSEALGVDPEALSFKGRLGISLGADGRGKAAATYQPGRKAINLTKFSGGGCLAHEWGHAMDHIFSEIYKAESGKGATRKNYLSAAPEHPNLPEDLRTAMTAVWNAITKHPNPEEAKRSHTAKVKAVSEELNKTITESNKQVRLIRDIDDKPKTEKERQDRLTHIKKNMGKYQQQLDTALAKKKEREAKGQKIGMTGPLHQQLRDLPYWISGLQNKMTQLEGPDVLFSEDDAKRMGELSEKVEDMRLLINRQERALANWQRVKWDSSIYHVESNEGGEYWSRPTEMFARAFESFVSDEMIKHQNHNSYLVSGAQGVYYPRGEERTKINTAMRKLVDTLKSGKYFEKALRYLESNPLQRFVIPVDMR